MRALVACWFRLELVVAFLVKWFGRLSFKYQSSIRSDSNRKVNNPILHRAKQNIQSFIMNASVKVQFLAGCAAIGVLAILVQAQYNSFDSDSNSESEGSPILARSELGKVVRNAAKSNLYNQQQFYQPNEAATRNLYNRQQPMQLAPSYHNNKRSSSGGADGLSGYGDASPFMGASSDGRARNSEASAANNDDDDDREPSNFGPSFGSNFDGESSGANNGNNNDDEGEGSSANNDASNPMNLNQAASGYAGQGAGDSVAFGAGFGFGADASAFGPSGGDGDGEGAGYGPSASDFGGDGRRAKSASSPSGSRNFGGLDDDAGAALRYGPNSAVNSGERDPDDEGRSAYSPEAGNQADQDNDDD